jgi:hypothetical protein
MADLQHAAAELAFAREQYERGTVARDAPARARESVLAARVAERRRQLAALGA